MRILFACVVYMTLPNDMLAYDKQAMPNGIAHFVDLTFIANDGFYQPMKIAMIGGLGLYALGLGLPIVLPLLLLCHVCVRTLFNSQGWVHHGVQMTSLVLLAQTIIVLTFAIYRLLKKKPFAFTNGRTVGSYMIFYSQMAIIAIYVVSVVSKVDRSGGQWFFKSHYIGLQVVKAERDRYYGKLQDPKPGDVPSARFMLAHPHLTRIFLGVGVMIELFAFLALYSRGMAVLVALGMISFHRVIAGLMSIYFHYNEMLLWIFLINVPFWIWWVARKACKKETDPARVLAPAS